MPTKPTVTIVLDYHMGQEAYRTAFKMPLAMLDEGMTDPAEKLYALLLDCISEAKATCRKSGLPHPF